MFDRFRDVPPSVSGRARHDPFVGMLDGVVSGVWRMTGKIRNMAPPREVDRAIGLRVSGRRVVAQDEDVISVTLTASGDAPLPRWHPGAHIDLRLPSGLLRQYSLCGDPGRTDHYRIAVRRIPGGGGGSVEVHEALHIGTALTTLGPRNAFPLTVPGYGSPAHRFRFIAGGIGITPILPMLEQAHRLGVDWSMLYTGRSRDSLPFLDELVRFGDRIVVRTDDVDGLPTARDLLGAGPAGTSVYACGPAPMLDVIRTALAGRGDVELHYERFAAPPVVDGAEFVAAAASSGVTVRVGADESLLAALTRAGVPAPYSCRQGFCGTCRTRVLDGAVDHRDTLLTGPERAAGMMLTCVSRAPQGQTLTVDL
jgi:ferredoxin-NADP reductase